MEAKQIEEERERVSKALSKRLEAHDESRKAAQEKLHKACEGLRAQIKGLEGKVESKLEEKFNSEDNRLQSAYEDLQMDGSGDILKMIQKAKAKLLVMQSYELVDHIFDEEGPVRKKMKTGRRGNEEAFDLSSLCKLKTERDLVPEMVELMRPTNIRVSKTSMGVISLQFTCLGPDEMKILFENGDENQIKYKCLLTKKGENEGTEYDLEKIGDDCFKVLSMEFEGKASYGIRVKMILGDKESEWSDEATIPGDTEAEAQEPSTSECNPEKLEEELENIKRILSERIEIHDENRKAAQEKLHEICEELRAQVEKIGEKINSELEKKFTKEDNRLQTIFSGIRLDEGDVSKKIQKAKVGLLVEQKYDVIKRDPDDEKESDQKSEISSLYELKTERKVSHDIFKEMKPTNVIPSFTEKGEFSVSFSFFSEDEVEALKELKSRFEVEMKIWEKDHEERFLRALTKELTLGRDEPICIKTLFSASTTYCLKMRIVHQKVSTKWSGEAEFTTPEFKDLCIWKECPDNVGKYRKYSVDEENPRIATKIGNDYSIIIGNISLPLNKVTSWSIKVLKSRDNDGSSIFIGIAPSNIDQNQVDKCGWYFDCYWSKLRSWTPHKYNWKEYGPRKGDGQYVHTGDSVGVVMDTTKGKLSFVLNGKNLGVAYKGIPLDKPLMPCVLLYNEGDSVELVI